MTHRTSTPSVLQHREIWRIEPQNGNVNKYLAYILQKKYIRGCKKDKTYNVSTHSFIYINNTRNIIVFIHKSLQTCIFVCPIQMSTFIKSDQSAPNLLRASPISRSGFVHPNQRVITGLTCISIH